LPVMKKVRPLWTLKKRRLYLPAVTIVMIVVTLTVMHALSTIRTLDRNRRQWETLLQKNAGDIIGTIKAEITLEPVSPDKIKELAKRIVENPSIAYLGISKPNGQWIAWDQSPRIPDRLEAIEKDWMKNGQRVSYAKVRTLSGGQRIFEVGEGADVEGVGTIVIGMRMSLLNEATRQDIQHALLMGVILLVLGSAAFFFIFVVQNYYLVDRTLAEMRSYTEHVVQSMASGLITVDTKGNIVSVNRKASEILWLDSKETTGKPLDKVIPSWHLNIHEILEQGRYILEKEIDCPREKGTVPVSVSVTPLEGPEDAAMGAVIILRDLREIRDLQEEVRRSERLASLGRLASGVAHEIRNPLSSIKGFAQYFRDKFPDGSEDKSYADVMIQEVDRLNRVIAELLDFARPKELRLNRHSLSQVLDHPLRLIQADLERKDIRLTRSSDSDETVTVDLDQMTQAFLNIFLNAMESMEHGGELRVEVLRKPEAKEVEVLISDTGPGISRENLSRIFDPFFSTKKKGTGLGLAITAKIIEAHQGEISVQSKLNHGTTFRIHLPSAEEQPQGEKEG
jgi:two-component system sensor histidine kinase HydH